MTDGGTARIELFGNGTLTSYEPELTVGSIEGDGSIPLSNVSLTVGRNNLSTTFAGVISDGESGPGTLTKIGTGTLTLNGANTYSGETTVSDGSLVVNNRIGSATGTGAVNVNAGMLGGGGTITGATNIGTGSGAGAFLAPSVGSNKPTTLTIQGFLTFKADGTYTYNLNTRKAEADQVVANGLSIQAGAQFELNPVGNKKLTTGQVFTAISNTSADSISGTFSNLPDGGTITAGPNTLQASYEGGDGNDLTLTVVQ